MTLHLRLMVKELDVTIRTPDHVLGLTWKNVIVDPPFLTPYVRSVRSTKSSADDIGDTMRAFTKNAAKLAVYEDTTMRVNNHQTPPIILPDVDL